MCSSLMWRDDTKKIMCSIFLYESEKLFTEYPCDVGFILFFFVSSLLRDLSLLFTCCLFESFRLYHPCGVGL